MLRARKIVEDAEDEEAKDEMMSGTGELTSQDVIELKELLTWNEHLDGWEIPHTSSSDYSGTMVERSNAAWFRQNFDFISTAGGSWHGESCYIEETDLPNIRTEDWARLKDAVLGLENYPVMDENLMSEMEREEQNEAWNEYYRKDFQKELVDQAGDYGLISFAARNAPDKLLDDLFYALEPQWEIETGGSAVIGNWDRILEDFPSDALVTDELRALYDQAKRKAWEEGLAQEFSDAVYQHFANDARVQAVLGRISDDGLFNVADTLLEQAEGWEAGDDATVTPSWSELKPALAALDSRQLLQAASRDAEGQQLKLNFESARQLVTRLLAEAKPRKPRVKKPPVPPPSESGIKDEMFDDPDLYIRLLRYVHSRPNAYLGGSVDRTGRYYHENSITVTVNSGNFTHPKTDEEGPDDVLAQEWANELEEDLGEWARDVSRKIYKALEAEYNYATGDESVLGSLDANGIRFNQEGDEDDGGVLANDLPEPVRSRVIDAHRNWNVEGDTFWSEHVIEEWKTWLQNTMGCSDPEIAFSGFWSQGDGASFTTKSIDMDMLLPELSADRRMPEWAR